MSAMVRVEMNILFFGILMHPYGNILIRAVASSEKNMGYNNMLYTLLKLFLFKAFIYSDWK